MARRGFTLVEILMVLAVMAILFGMVVSLLPQRSAKREAEVRGAADQLAATLKRARSLAMATGAMHAVVFNMAGSPGNAGRVPDNWTGGHWYRLLGPGVSEAAYNVAGSSIPIPFGGNNVAFNGQLPCRNFPGYLESMSRCWIGDPIRLPLRKVRFLALSDLDLGNRMVMRWTTEPGSATFCSASVSNRVFVDTYPRPWFGTVRQSGSEWLWYPWGGADSSASGSSYPAGGAAGFYWNSDGLVADSILSQDVSRVYYVDLNGDLDANDSGVAGARIDRDRDGVADATANEGGAYLIQRKGEVRPLVNGEWGDATIAFFPDGSAVFQEWNRARHHYATTNMSSWSENGSSASNMAGIRELSILGSKGADHATWSKLGGFVCRPLWGSARYQLNEEVAHFEAATGGWFLTLGPDAEAGPDGQPQERFSSPRKVLDAMLPAYRVFVSRGGDVRVVAVSRLLSAPVTTTGAPSFSAAASLWPASSGLWTNQAEVARWCRFGLKTVEIVDASSIAHDRYPVDPKAIPVTDAVTEQMLMNQQWWMVAP